MSCVIRPLNIPYLVLSLIKLFHMGVAVSVKHLICVHVEVVFLSYTLLNSLKNSVQSRAFIISVDDIMNALGSEEKLLDVIQTPIEQSGL